MEKSEKASGERQAAGTKTMVRCIVAGTNATDEPDLFFVKVACSESQSENGEHYDVAKNAALKEGYGEPFVVFDENDAAGKAMLSLFEWGTADIVSAGEDGRICTICNDTVSEFEMREHLELHNPNASGLEWKDVRDVFVEAN